MNKSIALLLALVLTLGLTACGNKNEATTPVVAETVTPAEATVAAEIAASTEAPAEAPTEAPTESQVETLFDTSWASNDFEKLIPQLPWTVTGEQISDREYMISTEYDALEYAADSDDYAALAAYVSALENYGFHVYAVNYGSEGTFGAVAPNGWVALDSFGNKISIDLPITSAHEDWLRAMCMVTIESASGDVVDTAALGGVLALLPDSIWTTSDGITATNGFMMTKFIAHDAVAAYCDTLLSEGCTLVEEGEPYMSYINKTFVSADGQRIHVQYEGREDYGTCRIRVSQE